MKYLEVGDTINKYELERIEKGNEANTTNIAIIFTFFAKLHITNSIFKERQRYIGCLGVL